jgi:hypothetical protein
VNVDLAPSARVVEPRPSLHHAPARSRDAAILAQLAAGWCTLLEIAEPCNLTRPEAYAIVRRLAREQPVFRRTRRSAKYKPFEYRVYPRALNVRLVPNG